MENLLKNIDTKSKLLKRFVADYSLPINRYDDSFDYYIGLYDNVYETKRKFELLTKLVSKLGSSEAFFEYSAKIQQNIVDEIKNLDKYSEFLADTTNIFSGKKWKWKLAGVSKGQVFKSESTGHTFLSIDLEKANYTALKTYSPLLVMNTDSYKEFIGKFTDEEYYIGAKKFRQIIFGQVNPKRQQTIQKSIIETILLTILEKDILTIDLLKDYTADEIVFDISNKTEEEVLSIRKAIEDISIDMKIKLHIEKYILKQLSPKSYFVREFDDGKVDFKCVPTVHMPQAYKAYFDIPVIDEDLIFYSGDTKEYAKFVNPLEFKII